MIKSVVTSKTAMFKLKSEIKPRKLQIGLIMNSFSEYRKSPRR